MNVLVCNAGSTSLKFKLFDFPAADVLATGKVERVGGDDAIYHFDSAVKHVKAEGQSVPNYMAGVKRFMDAAVADGQNNGYALTLMGRRRYLPELSASNAMVREFGKRAAMNTPVQGTAADIIKLAMVRVDEGLRRENLRSRLILQVHDELLLECPPEEVEAASRILQQAMEGVIQLNVPLCAEVHQGINWAEAH